MTRQAPSIKKIRARRRRQRRCAECGVPCKKYRCAKCRPPKSAAQISAARRAAARKRWRNKPLQVAG